MGFFLASSTERTSSIKVRVPSEHEHVQIVIVQVLSTPSTPKFDSSKRVSEHARCLAHPYYHSTIKTLLNAIKAEAVIIESLVH